MNEEQVVQVLLYLMLDGKENSGFRALNTVGLWSAGNWNQIEPYICINYNAYPNRDGTHTAWGVNEAGLKLIGEYNEQERKD